MLCIRSLLDLMSKKQDSQQRLRLTVDRFSIHKPETTSDAITPRVNNASSSSQRMCAPLQNNQHQLMLEHELNNHIMLADQLFSEPQLRNQLHNQQQISPEMLLPLRNDSYSFPPSRGGPYFPTINNQQSETSRLQHPPAVLLNPDSFLRSTIPDAASAYLQQQPQQQIILGNRNQFLTANTSQQGEEQALLRFQKEITTIQQQYSNKNEYMDFAKFPHTHSFPMGASDKNESFPGKLYRILDEECSEYISWMPHGRSWKVHDTVKLEEEVLPKYFRHAKYASFMRQVNGWGFHRISNGVDRDSYYHEMFLRGHPGLCAHMKRPLKSISKGPRPQYNFYDPFQFLPLPNKTKTSSKLSPET